MKIAYLVILFLSIIWTGCHDKKEIPSYKLSDKEYFDTKKSLRNIFDSLLENNQESFYPPSYDAETTIFLDTILFNKNREKIIVLLIDEVKNSKRYEAINMSKNEVEELDLPYEGMIYNGTIYIGKKDSTGNYKLFWIRSVLEDFNKEELSKDLVKETINLFSEGKYSSDEGYYWENNDLWEQLE